MAANQIDINRIY